MSIPAATTAMLGTGSGLFWSSDGGVSFHELVDLMEIGAPNQSARDKIEIPAVKAAGITKQYLLGLRDAGEFDFKQYFTKGRYVTLKALEGLNLRWRVQVQDGTGTTDGTSNITGSTSDFDGLLSSVHQSAIGPKVPIGIECKVVVNSDESFNPSP